MDYRDLYNLAQDIITDRAEAGKNSQIVPVLRLKPALIDGIPWLAGINFHGIETKEGDPLGHFECHSDAEGQWDEPDGWVALITYDKSLNWCKKRFVWCKELMHLFDTVDGCVKTPDEYRGLLTEIELKPLDPSEGFLTENTAKWKGLLVLCPKKQRDEMKVRAQADGLTDYDVALHFRIPEINVQALFSDYYDKYFERFITNA